MTGSGEKMARPKGTPWWVSFVAAGLASFATWALTSVVHVANEQAHLSKTESDALVLLTDALSEIAEMAKRIEAIDERTLRLEIARFGSAHAPRSYGEEQMP